MHQTLSYRKRAGDEAISTRHKRCKFFFWKVFSILHICRVRSVCVWQAGNCVCWHLRPSQLTASSSSTWFSRYVTDRTTASVLWNLSLILSLTTRTHSLIRVFFSLLLQCICWYVVACARDFFFLCCRRTSDSIKCLWDQSDCLMMSNYDCGITATLRCSVSSTSLQSITTSERYRSSMPHSPNGICWRC